MGADTAHVQNEGQSDIDAVFGQYFSGTGIRRTRVRVQAIKLRAYCIRHNPNLLGRDAKFPHNLYLGSLRHRGNQVGPTHRHLHL